MLNGQGLSWGWFQGGDRPSTSFALRSRRPATPASRRARSSRTSSSAFFANQRTPANSSNQALCERSPGRRRARRHGPVGLQGRLHPAPRAVRLLRLDGEPAPPHAPDRAEWTGHARRPKKIGRDTQSYENGVPQFNTPNHQYDTSDFDQLVAAIGKDKLPGSALPAVSFLKAPGLPGRPRRILGSGRRAAVRRERDQRARAHARLEEHGGHRPTTTPTAGMTTLQRGQEPVAVAGGQPDEHHVDGLDHGTSGQCGEDPDHGPARRRARPVRLRAAAADLVISPFARHNYVDHNLSDQASIINLVEYNWACRGSAGRRTRSQAAAISPRAFGSTWRDVQFNFVRLREHRVPRPGDGPAERLHPRRAAANDTEGAATSRHPLSCRVASWAQAGAPRTIIVRASSRQAHAIARRTPAGRCCGRVRLVVIDVSPPGARARARGGRTRPRSPGRSCRGR